MHSETILRTTFSPSLLYRTQNRDTERLINSRERNDPVDPETLIFRGILTKVIAFYESITKEKYRG